MAAIISNEILTSKAVPRATKCLKASLHANKISDSFKTCLSRLIVGRSELSFLNFKLWEY